MTTKHIEDLIDALAETARSWNEAVADDDRGPGNDMLFLAVSDDGSGLLGRASHAGHPGITAEAWHNFDDAGGLAGLLEAEGVELAEGAAPITEADLAGLARLEAEATPAPWHFEGGSLHAYHPEGHPHADRLAMEWIENGVTAVKNTGWQADGSLIAVARNALRGLLARLAFHESLTADMLREEGVIDQATRPLAELRAENARLREALLQASADLGGAAGAPVDRARVTILRALGPDILL